MALTPEQVAERTARLLPRGAIWRRGADRFLQKLLLAASDELARIYERAVDLLGEQHPLQVTETIDEWEAEYGLPLPCLPPTLTLQGRREALAAKVRGGGGQSLQYFVDVCAAAGITVTAREEQPFYVGVHGCGDPVGETDWAYVWTLTAPDAESATIVACLLDQIQPSHTYLVVIAAA